MASLQMRYFLIISKNLIWTELMDGMSGRVFVEFVIETDGLVSNVKVIRGITPVLDAEALQVIRASPKKLKIWF